MLEWFYFGLICFGVGFCTSLGFIFCVVKLAMKLFKRRSTP
jgi:hypothetical protein